MSLPKNIKRIFSLIDQTVESSCSKLPAITDDQIYVASFWLFYADYTNIYPPMFAVNTTAERLLDPANTWSPAEWKHCEIDDLQIVLEGLYEELTEVLTNANDSTWREVIREHHKLYCNLCLRMTQQARNADDEFNNWKLSSDFVFVVLEHQEGNKVYNHLVKESVSSQNRALFPGILL